MKDKIQTKCVSIGTLAVVAAILIVAGILIFGNKVIKPEFVDVDRSNIVCVDTVLYVNDSIMYLMNIDTITGQGENIIAIRNYNEPRGNRSLLVHSFDRLRSAGLSIDGHPIYTFRNDTCFVTYYLLDRTGKVTAIYTGEGYRRLTRAVSTYD